MNLHAVVRPAITGINPDVLATHRRSTGYTISPDGQQVASYDDTPDVPVQVQALTYRDLMHLDGLNIQGTRRGIYLNGEAMGIVRNLQAGGDLFIFPDGVLPEGTQWLVAHVIEQWPDWAKACLTNQVGP